MNTFSFEKICIAVAADAGITAIATIGVLFAMTNNLLFVFGGSFLTLVLFTWGVVFLNLFQKKLSSFTTDLCRTLDSMVNGSKKPVVNMEEESQLARISHRLERLYEIMQEDRRIIGKEKA